MKRAKYTPRRTGEDGISQEFITWCCNSSYKLIWNGHSHFALDEQTGDMYYINKKERNFIHVKDFYLYR